jgi:hypothetical protein
LYSVSRQIAEYFTGLVPLRPAHPEANRLELSGSQTAIFRRDRATYTGTSIPPTIKTSEGLRLAWLTLLLFMIAMG